MKYKIEAIFGEVLKTFENPSDLRDYDCSVSEKGYMLVLNYITDEAIYFLLRKSD